MSRSYRKSYSAITGVYTGSHDDKKHASRARRAAEKQVLREAIARDAEWDEVVLSHKYECAFNDVWGWGRDGNVRLQHEPQPEYQWNYFFMTAEEWYERRMKAWKRLHRK